MAQRFATRIAAIRANRFAEKNLSWPSNPCFFRFPRFFSFCGFPCCFVRSRALFSKDFKGSAEREILFFFRGSSLFCQKKQGLVDQGSFKARERFAPIASNLQFAKCNSAPKREFARICESICANRGSVIANPFPPYSVQKRPRPQICLKFVAAIVFGGKNLCLSLSENYRFSNFDRDFSKFQSPGLEPPKTIAATNFGQIWGFGRFWTLQGGKGFAALWQSDWVWIFDLLQAFKKVCCFCKALAAAGKVQHWQSTKEATQQPRACHPRTNYHSWFLILHTSRRLLRNS